MKYKVEIMEKAVAKARPRMNFYTHTTYTPKKTHDYEKMIKQNFLSQNKKYTPLEKATRVQISIFYQIPTSYTKKKKLELKNQPHTKKPDCDNLAKAILDALNGVAYIDDNLVSSLSIEKYYSDEDKIIIEIEEI